MLHSSTIMVSFILQVQNTVITNVVTLRDYFLYIFTTTIYPSNYYLVSFKTHFQIILFLRKVAQCHTFQNVQVICLLEQSLLKVNV